MGCCFSKSKTQNQNPYHPNTHQPHHHHHHLGPSLPKSTPTHEVAPPPQPPPPLEEESVKEVLSETPITKPHQVPILTPGTDTLLPSLRNPDGKFETKGPIPLPSPIIINNKEEEASEVVSQLSEEPCSVSESFSTATTITEKREDEATSKTSIKEGTTTTITTKTHKWNNNIRSPSRKRPNAVDGNVAGGRERRLKSPARRPEPSPEKKVHCGSRPVRGRESGPAANRKLNVGSTGVRRDAGEGSGRRSRSPSCARAVGTAGKVGAAGGGRKQVPVAKEVVEKEVEKGGNGSEEVGEKNDVVSQEESLENPLVSMECFIFL